MSDLLASLNQLEVEFSEAFAASSDGGNLSFAFFPIDGDAPDIGPMTVTGSLPHHILPATTWANPFGTCQLTDHAGQPHRVFVVVAGTRSSAEPYQAFGRLARRAGAACFRLPRGMAATGPGNAPEMNWLATVYSYLKGTAFVVEGAGVSRLQSVFAASVEVLSLIHRGDVNGNAPSYPGSLHPGLPGVEGETRFELEPLDLAARESTPPESSGSPPPPPPDEVREWLANRYRSIPPADIGNGPEGEPLAFDTLAPFTQYLTASGHRVLETLASCERAGWVRIVVVTIREPASVEVPVCLRRLNLSVGRHEVLGILPAVLPAVGATEASQQPPRADRGTERAEGRNEGQPLLQLLTVFTNGLSDKRIEAASRLLRDDKLTANEKLTGIDEQIRFPATASAEQLGLLLGVSKQAVMKSAWWKQNRRGGEGQRGRSASGRAPETSEGVRGARRAGRRRGAVTGYRRVTAGSFPELFQAARCHTKRLGSRLRGYRNR